MAKPKEERPKTFADFVKHIDNLQAKAEHSLWYRGCGKSTYLLQPSLFRHRHKREIAELSSLELQLMTRFRQRSIPFHDRSLLDDWDALFFMQHYGVPTRLLDWTENPLMALYFAVMSAPFKAQRSGALQFRADAAVWVLDPVVWNRKSLQHQSFDGGVLTPADEALKGYKPVPIRACSIIPSRSMGRITARGLLLKEVCSRFLAKTPTQWKKFVKSTSFQWAALQRLFSRKVSCRRFATLF